MVVGRCGWDDGKVGWMSMEQKKPYFGELVIESAKRACNCLQLLLGDSTVWGGGESQEEMHQVHEIELCSNDD